MLVDPDRVLPSLSLSSLIWKMGWEESPSRWVIVRHRGGRAKLLACTIRCCYCYFSLSRLTSRLSKLGSGAWSQRIAGV